MTDRATIGLTGLATMGRNLARNIARHGHTIAVHNRTTQRRPTWSSEFGDEGDFVGHRVARGVRRRHRAPARDHRHGQGRRAHRRRDRRAGAAARRGRHRRRRRQRALHRHPPARAGALREGPPLRRHGRLGRRGGRAQGPLDHGRRLRPRLRAPRPDRGVDRRAGRRHAVLRARRPRRRRALREDGAQRHRVRRHAAHRRVLRPAPLASLGLEPAEVAERLRASGTAATSSPS